MRDSNPLTLFQRNNYILNLQTHIPRGLNTVDLPVFNIVKITAAFDIKKIAFEGGFSSF